MSSELITSFVDTFSEAGDNARENHTPDDRSLITFLCESLAVLWKDWPKQMNATTLSGDTGSFSLSGTCPHCGGYSAFLMVGQPYSVSITAVARKLYSVMRCQMCLDFILGSVIHDSVNHIVVYDRHFPLGKPNDAVDENVPQAIASDFAEAMRCLWVKSHKAAVAMCRRSVEAACHDLGATGNNLYQKIESLAANGVITDPMRRMAHRVRLTGNANLHGTDNATGSQFDADDLAEMRERDAIAMITFTKEFFHHIYAIQALLRQYENPEGESPADAS